MVAPSNQSSAPDLSSSSGRDSSPSSSGSSSPAISRGSEIALSSRHVLPRDLDAAIKQLNDQELDRLVSAALEERSRRRGPLTPDKRQPNAEGDCSSLPQGKLNAIRAAFKAGVTPARIAREFGISRTDVQRVLADYSRTR